MSSSLGLVVPSLASHLIFLRKSFLSYAMGKKTKQTAFASQACYSKEKLLVMGLAQSRAQEMRKLLGKCFSLTILFISEPILSDINIAVS